jgi:hypothetical protein
MHSMSDGQSFQFVFNVVLENGPSSPCNKEAPIQRSVGTKYVYAYLCSGPKCPIPLHVGRRGKLQNTLNDLQYHIFNSPYLYFILK